MNTKEDAIIEKIRSVARRLPKFPDGRINYHDADTALVLTVFVQYNDKILLLKRSDKVGTYKGKWNTVTGYLDEPCPLLDKIHEELQEELGITTDIIDSYYIGESFSFEDPTIKKTWIVHPAMVILNRLPQITLDWEHSEYIWIDPQDMTQYDTVPNLHLSLTRDLLNRQKK
jgi:8-oxo-dGTP diphosphatase